MNARQIAENIRTKCEELGWTYQVRDSILTITKIITPNNNDQFVKADTEYSSILGMLPSTKPGSIWGTDGGGVGALTAMRTGVFTMNKSGWDDLPEISTPEIEEGKLSVYSYGHQDNMTFLASSIGFSTEDASAFFRT